MLPSGHCNITAGHCNITAGHRNIITSHHNITTGHRSITAGGCDILLSVVNRLKDKNISLYSYYACSIYYLYTCVCAILPGELAHGLNDKLTRPEPHAC